MRTFIFIMKVLIYTVGLMFSIQAFAVNLNIPESYSNSISAIAVDTSDNKLIYSYESETPRLIASNMKLFTTFIALEKLKPDYRYITTLYMDGKIDKGVLNGNLYLQGSGDPKFASKDLYQLFAQLKRNGIKQIHGNIILDSSVFNSTTTYSMLTNDAYDSDTIMPYGLIVDGNLVKLNLKLNQNKMQITSNLFGYKISNKLMVNNSELICSGVYKKVNLAWLTSDKLEISGSISPKCDGRILIYNLLSPGQYTKMLVSRTLDDFNIKLNGKYMYDKTLPNLAVLATHQSVNLAQMIIEMNYFSDNLMAETLMLTIGMNESATAITHQFSKQMYIDFLQQNGLYNAALQLENGAGLSRYEKVNVNNIARLLLLAQQSPLQAAFEASLPTPNGEGTLKNVLIEYNGRLHIKTGTLNDTRAYSGYFYSKNGHKYVVSMLGNINTQDKNSMAEFDVLFANLLQQLDGMYKNDVIP